MWVYHSLNNSRMHVFRDEAKKKIDVISLEMFLYEQLILNFIFYFAAKKVPFFFLEQILKSKKKKIDKGWVQNIYLYEK